MIATYGAEQFASFAEPFVPNTEPSATGIERRLESNASDCIHWHWHPAEIDLGSETDGIEATTIALRWQVHGQYGVRKRTV